MSNYNIDEEFEEYDKKIKEEEKINKITEVKPENYNIPSYI